MSRIYVNNDWHFTPNFTEKLLERDFDEASLESVRIPHTVCELPFNYFSEHEYQMVSGYRRRLFAESEWQGKRVLLTFGAAAHYAEVFLNGEKCGEHNSGYTAFEIDISELLRYGEDNLLVVRLDSRESLNTPPFGNVIDYMTYGGIYRDVWLDIKNPTYINDVFVKANAAGDATSEVEITGELPSDLSIRQSFTPIGILADMQASPASAEYVLSIEAPVKENKLTLTDSIENVEKWHVDTPNLYEVKTELISGREVIDTHVTRVGFRDAEYRRDGFYLNGEKLKLRGLNRHQSYAYVGYAMPKSIQVLDAEILKRELSLNTVRTSHYPQSPYFLDRCDELGLLVLTEIPGWQHIGDEKWQEQAVKNVEEMVLQYRNHPSIITWGVRINESPDNDALYTKTNETAHRLDPTRQTSGIRCIKKSSLLEDVYTYNDFVHDGEAPGCTPKSRVTSDMDKGYMITEYNGHMFPTKSFDCEEHRVEHALRHARVLNAVASHDDISGSCGWCMADYNTHKDFGSGDRICYHGVLDMFRNPKYAASVYAIQGDEPHLTVASSMDIGEHPACQRGKMWMFTNADSVKMYKNDKLISEFSPKNNHFPHLKNSPILIDDFIGDALIEGEGFSEKKARGVAKALNYLALHGYTKITPGFLWHAFKCIMLYGLSVGEVTALYTKYAGDWGASSIQYRFDAIKQSKVVKSVIKTPMDKAHISVNVSKNVLKEETTYDVSALRISAVDEHENLLHFSNEALELVAEGPIEIIGPHIIPLRGGMTGTYVKTTGERGSAKLKIKNPRLGSVIVDFTVE